MSNVVNLRPDEGFLVTDGPVEHGATEFWGKPVFGSGAKAHFYNRHPHGYRALCQEAVEPAFLGNGQSALFHAGNWPKCKRCMARLNSNQGG